MTSPPLLLLLLLVLRSPCEIADFALGKLLFSILLPVRPDLMESFESLEVVCRAGEELVG